MALTTVPVELANLDGAVTVNESSADVDFRVESNGNANMLFVDGTNDRVGIGTNSPTRQLSVENTLANSGGVIGLTSSDSSTSGTLGILHFGNSTDSSLVSINGIADGATDAGALIFKTEATGGSIEERMRIASDGHMGFNTSGIQTFTDYTSYHFGPAGTGSTAVLIDDSSGSTGRFEVLVSGNGYLGMRSNDDLLFLTNDSERGRIKNDGMWIIGTGLMAVGTTSLTGGASSGNVTIEFAGNVANAIKTRDTSGHSAANSMIMVSGSTAVGTIVTSTSSTTYNTSSDYRLKENVNYDWDALSTLKQLKPAKFNFKVDPDKTVEGFLAHEVSSLVPAAVNGEKDAMETRTKLVLDSKGEVIEEDVEQDVWTAGKEDETYPADSTWEASKEYPSYQQIDHSKLVPLMVKAIQELEAKVKALEEA
jgi:prepilin-type processing-associated H-X9-DG protein